MNQENEKKTECFCKSEFFRKFLVVALGTFVGAFCALSLFFALNKPPMPPMPYGPGYGYHQMHKCDCMHHKKMMMKKFMKHHKDFKKPIEQKIPDTED